MKPYPNDVAQHAIATDVSERWRERRDARALKRVSRLNEGTEQKSQTSVSQSAESATLQWKVYTKCFTG